ncbi:MAG: hypothetical protein OEZ22_10450 [Spirochaetia bacterium]|nr:hypothetical protein [Spirochaetia bacterium]
MRIKKANIYKLSAKIFFAAIVFIFVAKNLLSDPLFLTIPVEARGMVLSDAKVSRPEGASAMVYNPAGLGLTNIYEAELTHFMLGQDISANSFLMNYPYSDFFSLGISATALYLNEPFKKIESFEENSINLSVVDTQVGISMGYRFLEDFSAGLTTRYFRMQLGSNVGQGIGADVGFIYKFNLFGPQEAYKRFSAGIVFKNIGPDISFYEGGDLEPQPFETQAGISYEHLHWFTAYLDYAYSLYESSRFHFGIELLPKYYISPKLGFIKDFSGFNFTVGGSLYYGSAWKINAIGGASIGNAQQIRSANSFFSLLFQQKMYGAMPRKSSTEIQDDMELEDIDNVYSKYNLVPFKSGFRAEKIQGILLEESTAGGYLKKIRRLRRVAIQPYDEEYLKKMRGSRVEKMMLENRKISIWLDLREFAVEKPVDWWDMFSSIVESETNTEVITGWDVERLNENINAPLRVELRLEVRMEEVTKDRKEIRTVLHELYNNTVIAAKNFVIDKNENKYLIWQDIASFYAEYLKNIKGFYEYRIDNKQVNKS